LAKLRKIQGRYAEAKPLYQRASPHFRKSAGADHSNAATSLNDLASLYADQGCYREAEAFYQRALAIYEKALGPDHPYTAASLNNLALLYDKPRPPRGSRAAVPACPRIKRKSAGARPS